MTLTDISFIEKLIYSKILQFGLRLTNEKGKGKGPVLAIALLTSVRLVTRSASQSRKWQLIGMSLIPQRTVEP